MERKEQLPAGGCSNCGAYDGEPQHVLRQQLSWDGSGWVCRDCLRGNRFVAISVSHCNGTSHATSIRVEQVTKKGAHKAGEDFVSKTYSDIEDYSVVVGDPT